ncbi:MAG: lipocalin family protein [Bacteroidales bacterium]
MKIRSFFLALSIATLLVASSCATSGTTSNSNTERNNTVIKKNLFNGTWVVNSIDVDPGLKKLSSGITVLGEGDVSCFQGSTWHLISNNNTGTYTLPESSKCYSTTRNIVWSISDNNFKFKVVDEGDKAKNVTVGYNFEIINATEEFVSLRTSVMFLNKQCPITLNMTKQPKK